MINTSFTLTSGYYFVAAGRTGTGGSFSVAGAHPNESQAPVCGRTGSIGGSTTIVSFWTYDAGGNFITNGFPGTANISMPSYSPWNFIYFKE